MPNFWSKAGQLLSEAMNGARTQDKEFTKVCELMERVEDGMAKIKDAITSVIQCTTALNKFFKDLNEAINLVYDNSPFIDFVTEITIKHSNIIFELNELTKGSNKLLSRTSEWSKLFDLAKLQIKERDVKRKNYDHYEEKMLKLTSEKKKDASAIKRNEEKYQKAGNEYIEASENAFNFINDSIKKSYELVNPILFGLILNEVTLFNNLSSVFNSSNNPIERFKSFTKSLNNSQYDEHSSYDPLKYMNEKELFKRVTIHRSTSSNKQYDDQTENKDKKKIIRRGKTWTVKDLDINKNDNELKEQKNFGVFVNLRQNSVFGELKALEKVKFLSIKDDYGF